MNRFEQLIEYVINDEEQKARELFHDIVVEKSRQIYEDLMAEEETVTEESTEDEDEKAEKAGRKVTKDIEYDDKRDRKEKMAEGEDIDEAMGGDAADDLIDDVEMEEESDINMEDEDEEVEIDAEMDDEGDDHHADIGGEEELEDRVMDLEDKLDELMAEFEALMGDDGNGDMMPGDEGGDAIEMDDTEEMMPEMGGMPMPMEEAVSLKAAPKPVTSEEGSVNKKSTVAFNSGKAGMQGTPVDSDKGGEETGRPAPTAKDMISDFQNKAGAGMKDQKPAPKPQLSQAAGTNTRTPFPKG